MRAPFRSSEKTVAEASARLAEENARLRAELLALREFYAPKGRRRRRLRILGGALLALGAIVGGTMAYAHVDARFEEQRWAHANERMTFAWSSEITGTKQALRGAAGTPNGAYVVGDAGIILSGQAGAPWVSEKSGTQKTLYAVSAAVGRPPIVVGEGGTILRLDPNSHAWVVEPSGVADDLYGVLQVGACAYAVGAHGALLARGITGTWAQWPSPYSSDLHGLYAKMEEGNPRPYSVFAVGDGGTIVRIEPGIFGCDDRERLGHSPRELPSIFPVASPTTSNLYAITGLPGGELFAVGSHGTVARASAATPWTLLPSVGTEEDLVGVVGIGAGFELRLGTERRLTEDGYTIVALARDGELLALNLKRIQAGQRWTREAPEVPGKYFGLAAVGDERDSTLAVVGMGGRLKQGVRSVESFRRFAPL